MCVCVSHYQRTAKWTKWPHQLTSMSLLHQLTGGLCDGHLSDHLGLHKFTLMDNQCSKDAPRTDLSLWFIVAVCQNLSLSNPVSFPFPSQLLILNSILTSDYGKPSLPHGILVELCQQEDLSSIFREIDFFKF